MPIYEYECRACEHQFETIQKFSDDVLVDCPECGKPDLKKLVSKAAFRLKGAGWYETDFKSGNKKNVLGDSTTGDSKTGESKTEDSKSGDGKSNASDSSGSSDKSSSSSSSDTKSSSSGSASSASSNSSGSGAKKSSSSD